MHKMIGVIGVILFAIGGSIEVSPNAPFQMVLIPYGLLLLGMLLIGAAIYIHRNYHIGDKNDFYEEGRRW